jgi:hypothetical protein
MRFAPNRIGRPRSHANAPAAQARSRHMGMKLVANRRSTDPMIYRAPNVAPGNPPLGKDPRGYFSSARKGGGVEQGPDPHTNHSRNFRLEDPPQFFGQIFLGKNFGNKNRWTAVLAPLVTIFLATHAATPPATAPSLAQGLCRGRRLHRAQKRPNPK